MSAVQELSTNVLLISEDGRHVEKVTTALSKYNMSVFHASTKTLTFDALKTRDIALMNLVSPTERSLALLRAVRASIAIPMVAIVAGGRVYDPGGDIVSNVDDYVVTPWNVAELVSRMRAVLRRPSASADNGQVRAGEVCIDLEKRIVTVNGDEVHLTETEYRILSLIAHGRGQICGRERLLSQVLGRSDHDAPAALQVHISRIRKKTGRPDIVEFVPGYRLTGLRP